MGELLAAGKKVYGLFSNLCTWINNTVENGILLPLAA